MNIHIKYTEALEYLYRLSQISYKGDPLDLETIYENLLLALDERKKLLDKATPVDATGFWDDKCPLCKSFVRGGEYNDGPKFNFCPNCGQAIKHNGDPLMKRVY